jgi:hypothetical protein
MAEDRHAKAAQEARRDLERVRGESGSLIGSSMARAAKQAQAHFSGADAPRNDPVELWGRRIGRGLAVLFLAFLIWWLVSTYIFA